MFRNPYQKLVVVCVMALGLLAVLLFADDVAAESSVFDVTSPSQTQSIITATSNFVLYSRYDGDGDHSQDTVWLLDESGDTEVMDGMYPRLSPNGRYIVYKKGDSQHARADIYVRDLQTSLDTKVFTNTELLTDTELVFSYWWTDDSSQIVFDFDCDIYVMDRDGSNVQLLSIGWPFPDICSNEAPALNPVDGRITWYNDAAGGGLGVADADGSNAYHITNTVRYDYSPIWSPDGEWIAFWRAGNLFKIHPDGTGLTQLTFRIVDYSKDGDYINDTGAWMPSGEWLVAPAKVDGVDGLYAATTDGSGRLVAVSIRELACNHWVGSAGNIEFWEVFLPLVLKK
jgi:Tol biopolymer transport system component